MSEYFSVKTIVSVVVAMFIFEVLKKAFLGNLIDKIGGDYEAE